MRNSILFFIVSIPFVGMAMTPEEGIKRLMDGNKRYVSGNLIAPGRDEERRYETFDGQSPFAVVVTCSDSRVPPAIIFDQGVGDLFVVRDAGNVIAAVEQESVEYGTNHLEAPVVLVMGHENCGAVSAVLEGHIKGISAIAKLINPAVVRAKKERVHNTLEVAIKLNAINMRNLLLQSPSIAKRVKAGTLTVEAAYFDLDEGRVYLLD